MLSRARAWAEKFSYASANLPSSSALASSVARSSQPGSRA